MESMSLLDFYGEHLHEAYHSVGAALMAASAARDQAMLGICASLITVLEMALDQCGFTFDEDRVVHPLNLLADEDEDDEEDEDDDE